MAARVLLAAAAIRVAGDHPGHQRTARTDTAQRMSIPPLTSKAWPVQYAASSEARNRAIRGHVGRLGAPPER